MDVMPLMLDTVFAADMLCAAAPAASAAVKEAKRSIVLRVDIEEIVIDLDEWCRLLIGKWDGRRRLYIHLRKVNSV